MVEEACAMRPLDVVKKVEDAYGKVEERVVEVAVKSGAVTVPVKTPAPVTESGVPGVEVPMPTVPFALTMKSVEVPYTPLVLVEEAIVKRTRLVDEASA